MTGVFLNKKCESLAYQYYSAVDTAGNISETSVASETSMPPGVPVAADSGVGGTPLETLSFATELGGGPADAESPGVAGGAPDGRDVADVAGVAENVLASEVASKVLASEVASKVLASEVASVPASASSPRPVAHPPNVAAEPPSATAASSRVAVVAPRRLALPPPPPFSPPGEASAEKVSPRPPPPPPPAHQPPHERLELRDVALEPRDPAEVLRRRRLRERALDAERLELGGDALRVGASTRRERGAPPVREREGEGCADASVRVRRRRHRRELTV